MKRLSIMLAATIAGLWSIGSLATTTIATVNMQQIFHTAPQVKQIDSSLKSEFAGQRSKIETMSKSLQKNIESYQKNKSVMSSSELSSLKDKINQEEIQLRKEQTKFQQAIFAAQNKKMAAFLAKVKAAVKEVADQQNISVVLPSNAVIYSKGAKDITSSVMSDIK